jgi:glycosyltransferase involved in cell wall biosynthesis
MKENNPLVSICIISYNQRNYLKTLIDSILNQTYKNLELYIFDDCSNDGTQEWIEKNYSDDRLKYKNNPKNLGRKLNFLQSTKAGDGKYKMFFGGDDFLHLSCIETYVYFMEKHPDSSAIYTPAYWVDENDKVFNLLNHMGHPKEELQIGGRNEVANLLVFDSYITPCTIMIKTEILDNLDEIVDLKAPVADWDLYIRIAMENNNFIFLKKPLSYYRVHSEQTSQKDFYNSIRPLETHVYILSKILNNKRAKDFLKYRVEEIIQHILRRYELYKHIPEAQKYEKEIIKIQNKLESFKVVLPELKTKTPFISIILTTYNRKNLLPYAIESVLNQSYQNFELIVVNDAGEDVQDIINSFQNSKIVLITQRLNSGPSFTRNTALRLIKGDIVCYLDDDDIYLPNHIEKIVETYLKHNVAVVYTDSIYIDETIDKNNIRKVINTKKLFNDIVYSKERINIQNFIPINAFSHRFDTIKKVGYFNESLYAMEDWDLIIRLSRVYDFFHLKEITVEVHKRINIEDNLLRKERTNFYNIYKKIYDKYDNLGNIVVENERQAILKNLLHEKNLIENPAKIVAYLNHPFEETKGDYRELASFNGLNFLDEYHIKSLWQFDGKKYSFDLAILEVVDIIIVHNRGALFNEAILSLQAQGKRIIYLLDKNILDVNIKNSLYPIYESLKPRVISLLESADKVIVTSQQLHKQLKEYKSSVINVGVDAMLWTKELKKVENKKVKIAFFGNENELESLNFIKPTLEYISKNLKDLVELKIYGLDVDSSKLLRFSNLNPLNLKTPNYDAWINYLREQNIDIALLPSHADNFSKSINELKVLEYGLSNIAVIASDIEPYNNIIEHEKNGFLCSNTLKEWKNAIDILVKDTKTRVEISNNLFTKVLNEHTVQHNAKIWKELLSALDITNQSSMQDINQFLKLSWDKYEIISLERYPAWQKKRKFKNSDINIWAKEAEKWSYLPHFTLFIDVNSSNIDNLSVTLDSISTQIYPKWTFVVISRLNSANELFDTHAQLEWIQSELNFFDIVNQVVTENEVDYFTCMKSGAVLEPHALSSFTQILQKDKRELIYCDSGKINNSNVLVEPWFKPDFNLDYLRSMDYIDATFIIHKNLFLKVDGFDYSLVGAEFYDFILKAYVKDEPLHIDELLWHQPIVKQEEDELKLINSAKKVALLRELQRADIKATVIDAEMPDTFRVLYELETTPKVSIIIPSKNSYEILKVAISSILEKTSYGNYEIIIVDNASDEKEVLSYYKELQSKYNNIKIVEYNEKFNYSKACNIGAENATGEYYLFLNNDTEVLHENYLDVMLSYASREDIGVVGARLLFSDGTIQHAGIILGVNTPANHVYGYENPSISGYMNRLQVDQNLSAVTGACMMLRKDVFEKIGRYNDSDYEIFYSDIDICLKAKEIGYKILWTPHVTLAHHESKTVKSGTQETQEKRAQIFEKDQNKFINIWFEKILNDEAYNKNLDNNSTQSFINIDDIPHWNTLCNATPKIWAIPRGLDGGGEYRVISPLSALDEASLLQAHIGWNFYAFAFLMMKYQPDIILLQTPLHDYQIKFIEIMKKYFKGEIIFEIDDLLSEIPKNNPAYLRQYPNIQKRLKDTISLCDKLIVSTQPLKDAYKKYNSNTHVVANYLKRDIWFNLKSQKNQGKKPRVGWAGSPLHVGDLLIIKDVVKELKNEVEWVFMGLYPQGCKDYIHEFHPSVSLYEYPKKLSTLNLDLALVPLEINNFNDAKSNLRVLELGILKWPLICSDAYPYRDAPVSIVKNSTKAWVKEIRKKISNLDTLEKEGEVLRQWVVDNYILEDNLQKILKAYM